MHWSYWSVQLLPLGPRNDLFKQEDDSRASVMEQELQLLVKLKAEEATQRTLAAICAARKMGMDTDQYDWFLNT